MGRRLLIVLTGVILVSTYAGSVSAGPDTLSLDQCIRIALERDGSQQYGLPRVRLSYHQSQQAVWSAWGGLLPTLSHGYGYSYQKYPAGQVQDKTTGLWRDVPAHSTASWSTSFSLDHTLFDGGANAYRIAQAYHSQTAQAEQLRSAENDLVLGVRTAYFTLLKNQRLVDVQTASVKRAEQFLKTIQSKYDLGSASLSEVLKAKVQLGTEELGLLQRRSDVETARAGLNTILNRAVDQPLDVADVTGTEPTIPSFDDAVRTASSESPSIASSRASLRATQDQIGLARAVFFPTFSWNVRRIYAVPERNALLDFDKRYGVWIASASLSFSLFNRFDYKTELSNARVSTRYARETLDQAERAVQLAVKQQYLGVELARETNRLAAQTDSSAQQDFNLAQEKYNLGAATILDLLNAQESLTKAQNDRVNSLFDYFLAVARLENAMGRRP